MFFIVIGVVLYSYPVTMLCRCFVVVEYIIQGECRGFIVVIVAVIVIVINIVFREGAGVDTWTGLGDSSDIMGELQYASYKNIYCTLLEILFICNYIPQMGVLH